MSLSIGRGIFPEIFCRLGGAPLAVSGLRFKPVMRNYVWYRERQTGHHNRDEEFAGVSGKTAAVTATTLTWPSPPSTPAERPPQRLQQLLAVQRLAHCAPGYPTIAARLFSWGPRASTLLVRRLMFRQTRVQQTLRLLTTTRYMPDLLANLYVVSAVPSCMEHQLSQDPVTLVSRLDDSLSTSQHACRSSQLTVWRVQPIPRPTGRCSALLNRVRRRMLLFCLESHPSIPTEF
jgi:hypothetical protein